MADETKDWETTANRFVAFFDIMGFKDRILREGHEKIYEDLQSLSTLREKLIEINNKTNNSGDTFGESLSYTFSDSIIIFSKGDLIGDIMKILLDCAVLLDVSRTMKIPIKGALSYGKITIDTKSLVYFGQPIIDAYLLHEELLMYNAIIDNSFEKKLKELYKSKKFKLWLLPYKVQLKSGKINHFIMRPLTGTIPIAIESLSELYLSVSGKPRQYIDNTLEFLKSLPPDKPE